WSAAAMMSESKIEEGPGQPGRERRRPARADRRSRSAWQRPHCYGLPKACWTDEKSVLRTESGGTSWPRNGAEESRQARCRAHGAELNGSQASFFETQQPLLGEAPGNRT